ncbi:DUF4252 domain-containing protein [Flavobacteriaceae bacterium R38]|nr:DUF4252 domain-containing protein [Flavobacteriaceae bacterium R38]
MKKLRYFAGILFLLGIMISCNNGQSLQQYFVDGADDRDFISADLSTSLLNLSEVDLTSEQKEAYESLKKINVLAYRLTGENKAEYDVERAKVREILKQPKYQDLMKVNSGTVKASIKYLGDDDAIDEVIIFGTDKQYGFALIRVLGDDMKPESVSELIAVIQQSNFQGGEGLSQLGNLLGR